MKRIRLYFELMRFHRPIPILLLLWPVYIALAIAGQGVFDLHTMLIFTLGAIVMRAAGCVANDLADQKIDISVQRTMQRPLASGVISKREAFIILCLLLLFAFLLVLFLNLKTLILSCIALILALFYPLTKRFFILPQFILGLAYNFGIWMAFTAQDAPVTTVTVYLYCAAICWTLAYDTFYAQCDQADDQKLGLHSSALFFGSKVYIAIAFFQILTIGLFFLIGLMLGAGQIFNLCLVATVCLFMIQHWMSDIKKDHLRAFTFNHWVGFFLFLGTESIFI